MRRLWRGVLALTIVAAIVVVAGLLTLRSDRFHEWLRRQVVSRSAPLFDGDFAVGAVTGDVLHGITLHDVTLRRDGQLIFSLPLVSASYDVIGLLRRRFVLEDVVVSDPIVHVRPIDGRWTILKPSQHPTGSSPAVDVRGLRVNNGTLTIQTGAAGTTSDSSVRLSALAIAGSLAVDGQGLHIVVDDLAGRDDATAVVARHASAAVSIHDNVIAIPRFDLTTALSHVSGSLTWPPAGQPLTATVHGAPLAFRELAAYVPGAIDASLSPGVDVQASGTASAMHIVAAARQAPSQLRVDAVLNLSSPTLSVAGSAALQQVDLGRIARRPDLAGTITGNGTFFLTAPRRSMQAMSVTFQATAPRADVGRYRARNVVAAGTYAGGGVQGTIKADAYGAGWNVRGHWTPGPSPSLPIGFAFAGHVTHLNLPDVGDALDIAPLRNPRLSGQLNGDFDVEGSARSFSDQQTTASATLTASTLNGVGISEAAIDATIHDHQLSASASGTASQVTARSLGLPGSFDFATAGDFDGFLTIADLRQPVTLESLDAALTATLGPSSVSTTSIDSALLDVSLDAGLLTVRQLDATGALGHLTASGDLALAGAGTSHLVIDADAADLGPLGAWLGRATTGRARMSGTIAGTVDQPSIDAVINGQLVSVESEGSAVTTTSHVAALIPGWHVDQATGTLETDGSLVTLRGADFQRVTVTAAFGPTRVDLKSLFDRPTQSIAFNAVAAPHPDWKEFQIQQFELGTPTRLWKSAAPDITVRYAAGDISVTNAALVLDQQQVTIAGSFPISAAGRPGDLTFTLANVQVADLNAMALGQHKLTGRIDGTAEITGRTDKWQLKSHVDVTAGAVDTVTFQRVSADLGVDNGTARIDLNVDQTPSNHLEVTGTAPLDEHAAGIDLRLQSSALDVRLLQPFVSAVTFLRGTVEGSARITGSRAAPNIQGSLGAVEAAFSVPANGISYQHLNGQVDFTGEQARISTLTMEDDDKHVLKAEGGMQGWWGGSRAIDVKLSTEGFHVLKNGLGTAGVDVDLHVAGSLTTPEITGRVQLTNARLDVGEWLSQLDQPSAPDAAPSFMSRTVWHVDLEVPNNLVLQGHTATGSPIALALGGINATVGGTVKIDKEAAGSPILTGHAEVSRGTYQFQGRPFQIANGSSVEFRSRTPIDPDLSISAERQISGATVDVVVSGTARAPKVTLSSDPPLDQGDILALIVFNQPINELGETQRTDLASRAASMATGALTSPLASAVANALDLDIFEITPTSDTGTGPTIALGRQISGNLFVRLQQGVTDAQDSQLSIEYQFSKFLRLVTSIAQNAPQSTITRRAERSGIDLIFVIKF